MNKQIKDAFENIHAEDELKRQTRSYILNKSKSLSKYRSSHFRFIPQVAVGCLALFLLFIGGNWLYFTQTALISIDVNPSLELGVNRFNRIISVKGINDDGIELASHIDLINKDCRQAINELINSTTIQDLESNNEVFTITVTCGNTSQSKTLMTDIENCTQGHENMHCHSISVNEAAQAKTLGLPVGKYRGYLILKQYEPSITPEEVANMTMRELNDRIAVYEGSSSNSGVSQESLDCQNDEHSNEAQHQHRHGTNHE